MDPVQPQSNPMIHAGCAVFMVCLGLSTLVAAVALLLRTLGECG